MVSCATMPTEIDTNESAGRRSDCAGAKKGLAKNTECCALRGESVARTAYLILLRAFCPRINLRRSSRFFFFRAALAGVSRPNNSTLGAFTGFASLMSILLVEGPIYRGAAGKVGLSGNRKICRYAATGSSTANPEMSRTQQSLFAATPGFSRARVNLRVLSPAFQLIRPFAILLPR